jgi:uncharacterized protein (DUF58 family)
VVLEAAGNEFGFAGEQVIKRAIFLEYRFRNDLSFRWGQVFDLFQDFRRTHEGNLLPWFAGARHGLHRCESCIAMTTAELLETVRRVEVRTNRLVNDTMVGAYLSQFRGRGMDFEELREYMPGDDVRDIDWNVTNRMGRPFVKRFREERELGMVLAIDISASSAFGSARRTKREFATEIAATLAISAARASDKVALLLFTEQTELYLPPRKGRRHILRLIREMLSFEPKRRGTDITAALSFLNHVLPRRSMVFLLTDFLHSFSSSSSSSFSSSNSVRKTEDEGRERLGARDAIQEIGLTNARHDLICVHLHDPRESELPAAGLLTVEDAETGELLELDTNRTGVRQQFARTNMERLAELDRALRHAGVDTLRLSAEQPFAQTLQSFFELRRGRRRG